MTVRQTALEERMSVSVVRHTSLILPEGKTHQPESWESFAGYTNSVSESRPSVAMTLEPVALSSSPAHSMRQCCNILCMNVGIFRALPDFSHFHAVCIGERLWSKA